MLALNEESRLENGSSINNRVGFLANVLARATLCCWPPDNSEGYLSASSLIFVMSLTYAKRSVFSFSDI